MVAFFEIARSSSRSRVCVKEDTVDTYSGGRLQGGGKQINAQQRCPSSASGATPQLKLLFTDLDRSAASGPSSSRCSPRLKQNRPSNPVKISGIVDVASATRRSTAASTDHAGQDREHPQGGNLSFFTLPVASFDNVDGRDVNVVDLAAIRATVRNISTRPTDLRRAGLTDRHRPSTVPASPSTSSAPPDEMGRRRPCSTASPPRVSPAAGIDRDRNRRRRRWRMRRRRRPRQALATYLGGVTPGTSLSAGTMVLTIGSGWTHRAGWGRRPHRHHPRHPLVRRLLRSTRPVERLGSAAHRAHRFAGARGSPA